MSPTAATAAERMDVLTKERLFTAARRAALLYPGPVGQLLSQELLSWMVFGHRLGCDLIMRLAADLNTAPRPSGVSPETWEQCRR